MPPAGKQPRRIKPQVYWILAAAVLIAVAVMVAAVYFLDPPSTPSAGPRLAVQTQVECETIRHAHEVWEPGRAGLDRLPTRGEATAYEAGGIADQGEAFLDATKGYEDQPSRELALAIAAYNYQFGDVVLKLKVEGILDQAAYGKSVSAWQDVEASYGRFLHLTCGQ